MINLATVQLRTTATDKVGATRTRTTPTFIVDTTAPTAIAFTGNTNRTNQDVTATGTSTDVLAGLWTTGMLYKTTYAFGADCAGGTTTVPVFTSDGYQTGYACIYDRAGNIRTGQQGYKIDKTAPIISSMTSTKSANAIFFENTTVTDVPSGIASYLWAKIS